MGLRPRTFTLLAAGVGALVTLVVTILPFVRFAYRSESLHIAIETTSALIAALAAYLIYGRVRRRCSLNDLALVAALVVFAFANLFLSALPAAFSGEERGEFATWAPLFARLLGAAMFAASALLPPVPVTRARHVMFAVVAACSLALAGIAAAVLTLGDRLPEGLDPRTAPHTLDLPEFAGHPSITALQVLAALLFGLAAAGFTRRAGQTGDELMKWFAAGSALAALARVNYAIFPSLYSDWVYTGDALRLAFYLVILLGAAREIRAYWRDVAEAAVLEERRRLARDLHDGLAQELAFIKLEAQRLARQLPDGARGAGASLAVAADRALFDARRAIAALTEPIDRHIDELLAETAQELASRAGARVNLNVEPELEVEPHTREELLRIVREAITNATRHGRAETITVELSDGGGLRLRVADDGRGFDPDGPTGAGFGLTSMRERAEALGGEFRIASRPGVGTEMEVRLP